VQKIVRELPKDFAWQIAASLSILISAERLARFFPHQQRAFIELLIGIRPVPVDVMQKHLDERLSR
jgi:hypothetical protein